MDQITPHRNISEPACKQRRDTGLVTHPSGYSEPCDCEKGRKLEGMAS